MRPRLSCYLVRMTIQRGLALLTTLSLAGATCLAACSGNSDGPPGGEGGMGGSEDGGRGSVDTGGSDSGGTSSASTGGGKSQTGGNGSGGRSSNGGGGKPSASGGGSGGAHVGEGVGGGAGEANGTSGTRTKVRLGSTFDFGGDEYALESGFALVQTDRPEVPDGVFATMLMSDFPDSCEVMTESKETPFELRNVRGVGVVLGIADKKTLELGTYPIDPDIGADEFPTSGRFGLVQFERTSNDCAYDFTQAQEGEIELTGVTDTSLKGRFSVRFGDKTYSGNFNLPTCQQFLDASYGSDPSTCEDP